VGNLDPIDYDPFPGAPQQTDAPLRITVHPQRAELRLVPVDHDPFADDGAAERVLTRLGVGSVPNTIAGSWGSDPAAVEAARFPDAGLPDAIGDARQFTPISTSYQKRAAASILSCDIAYIR